MRRRRQSQAKADTWHVGGSGLFIEKPHLRSLPDVLPPVYELLDRIVDLHGYVSVDTNRYSVPERFVGQSVAVYKLPAEIRVCRKDITIAVHRRLIGAREAKNTLPGHHTIPVRQNRGTRCEEASAMKEVGFRRQKMLLPRRRNKYGPALRVPTTPARRLPAMWGKLLLTIPSQHCS